MSAIPDTMTAIAIREAGGPDVLQPVTEKVPQPKDSEILIKVMAAGVNRPDVSQRQGRYPPPAGASPLPGLEVSGVVAATGPGASEWNIGDEVCALTHGGGYAEYVTADQGHALARPNGFSWVEAAGIPETFFTVWVNGFMTAKITKGETVLCHGGSSGIGTTLIMLAKEIGARVIVTAGSDEKCAFCIKLGADAAINYKTQDFVAEVKTLTGDKGANVILDMVAGPYVQRNFEAAAMDARIGQIALQLGYKIENLDIRPISAKRLTWTGSALRPRTVAQKSEIARALKQHVAPMWAAGKCRPVIDSTFSLHEAAQAHARMESSQHQGKIILTIGS